MTTQSFVEDSFILTAKSVFDNIRNLIDTGPSAFIKPRLDIDYWPEDLFEPSIMFVSVGGSEPQRIKFELERITFGERAYFRCVCKRRAAKLYLPPNGTQFKCRTCHGLQYRLSTINRHSVAGKTIYRLNRLQKLADSRASMGRILYRGNFSKRFERFLGLCDRAGLDSIVRGAEDLKTLIKG